jgi:chromate transporter
VWPGGSGGEDAEATSTARVNHKGMGTPWEVLRVFLRLGSTSFGGPIAHLGYFHEEFVVRRRWVDEESFADLVALCQFLPGPASSQVAFALGLGRAGGWGAAAAWVGFTLPSVVLMLLFAVGADALSNRWGRGALVGLKLVAVAIIAQAVLGMARSLCPDRQRATIAVGSALVVLSGTSSIHQVGAILLGGVAGLLLCRGLEVASEGRSFSAVSHRLGVACLCAFALLLVTGAVGVRAWPVPAVALFEAFYRAGALVFGGGHVVLPLLRSAVVTPGWVTDDVFLAGYGAAQALPGPLFSFAAYLGDVASPVRGVLGGLIALVGIYLPGILILIGSLPFWDVFRRKVWAQAGIRGVNAAVVGLLGAALYDPVWTSSVHARSEFGVALVCFTLLTAWKAPPLLVVLVGALSGLGMVAVGMPWP